MIGRTISRFHILEELGRGGMATVWKARDQLLGRHIALKVLDQGLAETPGARDRFRREAEIVALLEHPSIVPVYEAGEREGLAYLVMKLVQGETVAQRIRRRLPPVDEALRITQRVADALGYAHACGVIHRDVTPRNIMIAGSDEVVVVDFGLARVAGRSFSSSGHVVGTPSYLAPEVMRGERADARSDIYSLGVVLYEMLTGAAPFTGEYRDQIVYDVLNRDVAPPSARRPEIGADVDALVMRMMSREPAGRPATTAELTAEIARLRGAAGAAAPAPEPPPAGEAPSGEITRPIAAVAREGVAERLVTGRGPVYLAVLPIEHGDGDRVPEGLDRALRAELADLEWVRVVADDRGPRDGESGLAYARRAGANLLLRTMVRVAGTALRVTYGLIDPEAGVQIAGGSVDGSTLEPFPVEDALIGSVRGALRLPAGASGATRVARADPVASERLGQALAFLRRTDHEPSIDAAVRLLEQLAAVDGAGVAVHAALARAYVCKYAITRQRAWETRAAQACARGAERDPEAPELSIAQGELHAVMGLHAEALADADRALAAAPEAYEAHVIRARALDGLARRDGAEAACRRAIALRPDDPRAYTVLGLVLFRQGRYAEAIGPWQRVTELSKDNVIAQRNLGSALFHLDRFDEAIAAFRRAIEIQPEAAAFTNLGTVLYYLERWEEAAAAFEKAVALNQQDARAWGNLGNACRWMPGDRPRMREALDNAVALMRERFDRGPGTASDWARLAGWLANLDRRDEATTAIRRALAMSADDTECMAAAGHVLLRLGERDEALQWLERAVTAGYGVDTLRRSPDLRPLKGDPEFERILAHGGPPDAVE